MKILALDLGSHLGWAVLDNGDIVRRPPWLESGAETFDVKRGESPGMRYVRFNAWLMEVGTGFGPEDLIVYEQTVPFTVRYGGASAREIAAGFATRVQEYCAVRSLRHTTVWPSALKKWTTGHGNADKAAMLDAVRHRWRRVDTSDEADAIALAYYAIEEILKLAADAAPARPRRRAAKARA